MEKAVIIDSGEERLEGLMDEKSTEKAVIITHPHPLYGGSMHNSVVETIAAAYNAKGYTTLRFNFRGTGRSSGSFDDGRGELEDVRAALTMMDRAGYGSVVIAGYSFGSRINAEVVSGGCSIDDHIMVSPPVAFMNFDDITSLPSTGLIISGSRDEYAPPSMIERHIKKWNITPAYHVMEECDHFYTGCLDRLQQLLADYLS